MIGVNPPGHFLWYPKTTDEQIRRYARLCAEDATCSRRTGDLAATLKHAAAHAPDQLLVPADQKRQRTHRLLLRPHGIDVGGSAALGPDDAGLVDLGSTRRRQRALVRVARSRPSPSRPRSSGETSQLSPAPTPGRRNGYFSSGTHARLDHRQPRRPTSLFAGGRLLNSWPANPTENEYATFGLRRCRHFSSAASSTSRRRLKLRHANCSRTSRTATRSCWPVSATRPRSGATSRKQAPGC